MKQQRMLGSISSACLMVVLTAPVSVGCSDGASGNGDAGADTSTDPASDTISDVVTDVATDTITDVVTDTGTDVIGDVLTDGPHVGDFYVAMTGDDDNPGTEELPWRTIQKGVDTISPGQILVVKPGAYGEHVTVANSGTSEDERLYIVSETLHDAGCTGFVITGDWVTVDGFDIEATATTGRGVFVDGADRVDVLNNYVHECPSGGIDVSGTSLDALSTHARVMGNHMDHNGQWGVHVVGSHALIENNEVERTVQHHPKIAYTGFHGEDADGLRIFGDNHTIRLNYLHDLGNVEDPGNHQGLTDPAYPSDDYPHVDCLQTWDRSAHGGRPVMTDTLIERNHCRLSRASGKGLMISAVDAPARNLVIRNNIFEYRDIGVSISLGTFENILIHNNLFKAFIDDTPWGAAVSLDNTVGFQVVNNMMIDCHAEARHIIGTGVIDYNLVWWSSGVDAAGTPSAREHEIWNDDPLFQSFDGEHGGDYHLTVDSPAIGAGIAVDGLTEDHDGVARPADVSIGPYEYVP